jgi:hypothetical protein
VSEVIGKKFPSLIMAGPPLPLEPPTFLDLLPLELRRNYVAPSYALANENRRADEREEALENSDVARSLMRVTGGLRAPIHMRGASAAARQRGITRMLQNRVMPLVTHHREQHHTALVKNKRPSSSGDDPGAPGPSVWWHTPELFPIVPFEIDEESLPLDIYRQYKFIRKET